MRFTAISVLLALTLSFSPYTVAAPSDGVKELRLGVFPRRGEALTRKLFTPLVEKLSEELGVKVSLETSNDFASFWSNVAKLRYDIVHYNQYHYVKSNHKYGYKVFAKNVEFGNDKISAAIVVRKDSGFDSLQDLRGKKIVFGGGRSAMVAYITTTYLLRNAGLKEGDYFEQFALNPPKATIATYYRQAAAAGAGNYVLDLPNVRKQIDEEQMKYLAVSESMPHLPWAVKSNINDDLKLRIQNAMVNLSNSLSGRDILKSARVTRFVTAEDSEFDENRMIIKTVLGESY